MGAGRPYLLSTSALFRAVGWRVIAIEPNPHFCAEHRAEGHEVLQYAWSDHDQDSVEFSIVNSGSSEYGAGHVTYESFSLLAIKDSYRALHPPRDVTTIKVDVRKLDTILREHAPEIARIGCGGDSLARGDGEAGLRLVPSAAGPPGPEMS